MRYEGNIYRPPSEAYSYILQVTVGCAHNKCRFCYMYKDKSFHLRSMEDVLEDLAMARARYSRVGRIFLADGDALCLSNDKLLTILGRIKELFPECERVGIYGSAKDCLRKTDAELIELREAGLQIVYLGAESGSDRVLESMCKGATRAEIIQAVRRVEEAGIMTSVTFISGLGGQELWEEHGRESGTMISEMMPSYVGLLTLMVEPVAPIYQDIKSGTFQLLSAEQVLRETKLLMEHIDMPETARCVFRSNHASNYVSLKGDLPADRDRMIAQLDYALENPGLWKDELWRRL